MDESEEDNIKIIIGPFIITNKQLGDGTSGSVRLGIHEGTKESVAIKEIRKKKYEIISERISNNELEEIKNERELLDSTLLEQEIEIFKILHHPYICRYYYKANYNSDCYIVSEYLKNKNIIDYIYDSLEKEDNTFNIFDEKFICKIFCQMLSAIEYMHNNYIVHRDIKLENTIFDEYGDIKLTDFGFSKKLKKGEYLQDHRGSEIYSSPEVIVYENDYDGYLADIWSLGVCLFFLIFKDYPFSNDAQDFKEKLRDSDLTFPEAEASDLVKDLIKKILEKNPKKRINIAQIKQHPWLKTINFDFNKSRGIYLDKDIIPIDTNVVREIGGKNEQKIKKIIKDILTNAHNNNTCTYYLKIEQRKRKNIKSIADIRPSSDLFINYINSEKSQLKYYNNDIDKIVEIYTANIMTQIQEEEQAFKKAKSSMIDENNLNKTIEYNNNIDKIDKENKIKQNKEKMKKRSNSFGKLKVLKKSIKEENSKNLLNAKNIIKVNKVNIMNKKMNNIILVYGILEDIIKKALNSIKDKEEEIEQINNINIGKKSAEEKIKKNTFSINVIEEFGFIPSIQKADKTAPFGFYKPKNKLKEIKTKESGGIKEEKNKNKLFDKNKNKKNKIEPKNLINSKYNNHSTIDIKLTDKKKTKILKTEENKNKNEKNKVKGIIHNVKTKIANAYKSIKNKFHKEKKNNEVPNKIKNTKPKKRSNSFDMNSRHDLYKLIHDKEVKVLLSKKRHKSQNKDLKSMSSPQKKGKKLEKKAEKFINKKVNKNPIRITDKSLDTNLNINEEISKRRFETKNSNNIPKPKKNNLKNKNTNRNNRKLNASMSCTLTPNSERSVDNKKINTRTITQESTNRNNNDKSIIKKKTKIAGKTFLIFRNNNKNSTINKTKTTKAKIFKSTEITPKKTIPIKTSIFKKDLNNKKSSINVKQSIHSSRQKNLNKFDLESNSKDTIDTSSRKKSFVINSKINTQRKSINKKLRINSIDSSNLRKKEDEKINEIKVKKDLEATKEIIANYFGEDNTTVTKSKSGIKIGIKMFFGKNKLEFKLNLIQAEKNKCNITAELIKGDSKNFDEIFLKLKEKLK